MEVESAHSIRCDSAIDGEIVCLGDDGKSNFHQLQFRREWPFFFAFDVLKLDGENLGQLPLLKRKRRLKQVTPKIESRLRCVAHIEMRGLEFFELACEEDLEGIAGESGRRGEPQVSG